MKSQEPSQTPNKCLWPNIPSPYPYCKLNTTSLSASLVRCIGSRGNGRYRPPGVVVSRANDVSGVSEREAMDCSSSIVWRRGPVAVRGREIDSSYPGGRVNADGGARVG